MSKILSKLMDWLRGTEEAAPVPQDRIRDVLLTKEERDLRRDWVAKPNWRIR